MWLSPTPRIVKCDKWKGDGGTMGIVSDWYGAKHPLQEFKNRNI
jgi:hypothetical protein